MNRLIAACILFSSTVAFAQSEDVPDRADGEGVGQFERLVLRGGYLIDGKYFRSATIRDGRYYVITNSNDHEGVPATDRPECDLGESKNKN